MNSKNRMDPHTNLPAPARSGANNFIITGPARNRTVVRIPLIMRLQFPGGASCQKGITPWVPPLPPFCSGVIYIGTAFSLGSGRGPFCIIPGLGWCRIVVTKIPSRATVCGHWFELSLLLLGTSLEGKDSCPSACNRAS